jgi:STE24 endopeptidase
MRRESVSHAIRVSLSALALILSASMAKAQAPTTEGADTSQVTTAADSLVATAIATGSPDYLAEVRANYTPEARRYWTTQVVLDLFGTFYGIVVGLLFLFTGLSARIRDIAHRAPNLYGRGLIYITIYSLIAFVLSFPLTWYSGYVIEHQYALSNQSFGEWMVDELKGLAIGIAVFGGTGLVALAYFAIRKSPRRWWIHLAIGSVPVVIIFSLLQPLVIDPMFNKFVPLKDQQLKTQILDLASKAGIPGRNVYEVDKSKQTKKYNAYVSGWGASQRIVLWDTILEGMEPDEILFVMGHEMGHYRLGHIWKGIGFFSIVSFGLFFGSGLFMTWAVRRFGHRWGFTELHDLASIPLFGIALSLVGLLVQPLSSSFTRIMEHESDTFALEVTHLNDAGARAFMKLGLQNKSNPEPPLLIKWWRYSHPPLVERVRYAIEYRPWEEGKPNQKFKPVAQVDGKTRLAVEGD